MSDNLALDSAGAEVVAVTAFDPARPKDNMIDGDLGTFWSTTGLFPQEVVVKLSGESHVTSIETVTTNAQLIDVKYTDTVAAEWDHMCSIELGDRGGSGAAVWSRRRARRRRAGHFIKFIIRKGWDDFVTVHKLTVSGEAL